MANLTSIQRAVPTADATDNIHMRDVSGNKSDAEVQTVDSNSSIIAYLKAILNMNGDQGMGAWPPGQPPGAGTNFAEVLCQIYDQTLGSRRIAIGNWNFTDDGGANPSTHNILTVTGDVMMVVFAICKDTITTSGGTPTIELGVSGNTARLIQKIVDARDVAANEIWHDADVDATIETLDLPISYTHVISNGQDVIFTIGGAAITAGELAFYILWSPLSTNGSVVVV